MFELHPSTFILSVFCLCCLLISVLHDVSRFIAVVYHYSCLSSCVLTLVVASTVVYHYISVFVNSCLSICCLSILYICMSVSPVVCLLLGLSICCLSIPYIRLSTVVILSICLSVPLITFVCDDWCLSTGMAGLYCLSMIIYCLNAACLSMSMSVFVNCYMHIIYIYCQSTVVRLYICLYSCLSIFMFALVSTVVYLSIHLTLLLSVYLYVYCQILSVYRYVSLSVSTVDCCLIIIMSVCMSKSFLMRNSDKIFRTFDLFTFFSGVCCTTEIVRTNIAQLSLKFLLFIFPYGLSRPSVGWFVGPP